MSDLVICKFRKSMVIHDAKCPYWDQVSLNNTSQPTNLIPTCWVSADLSEYTLRQMKCIYFADFSHFGIDPSSLFCFFSYLQAFCQYEGSVFSCVTDYAPIISPYGHLSSACVEKNPDFVYW